MTESAIDRMKRLRNRNTAWLFLKDLGYKVSRGKFYQAVDDKLVSMEADGSLSEIDVLAFAGLYLEKIGSSDGKNDGAIDKLQQDLKEAELDRTRAQAEKYKFELEKERGKYILKDDMRLQTALKIAAFESGFKNLVRVNAADLIYKVGGDASKSEMFCNIVFGYIDGLLGEFGDMDEIGVRIVKGVDNFLGAI